MCPLIVCGADEKILRLLEPIPNFLNTLNVNTDHQLRL